MRHALVTGSGGQDGSYLGELLASNGYHVHGVARGDVDLTDGGAVLALVQDVAPDEIYHLAGESFVPASWDDPIEQVRTGALATTSLLEAARRVGGARFLFASSADVFGLAPESPQTERTPLRPMSPYGAGKAYGMFLVDAYRRRYGLHASSAILYNHESPRRRGEFLPSKVAHGVAAVAAGRASELVLGDLDAERDWGYAPDYVRAMWLMTQQDAPDDYVVATGELHSVGELVETAFAHVGLDWRAYVRVDESLKRGASQLHGVVGDATRARERLGWAPTLSFTELVAELVDAAIVAAA